jgi:hypothetical protein
LAFPVLLEDVLGAFGLAFSVQVRVKCRVRVRVRRRLGAFGLAFSGKDQSQMVR